MEKELKNLKVDHHWYRVYDKKIPAVKAGNQSTNQNVKGAYSVCYFYSGAISHSSPSNP
jgi:hypothetical protein